MEVTDDVAELAAAGVAESDMVVVCDDDLGKNLVRVDRIRDVGTTDVPERVARTMLATS